MRLQQFTVIGVWDNTGRVYVETFLTRDALDALRLAAKDANWSDDLQLLGAVPGAVPLMIAPTDVVGCTAYARDLRVEGE